MSGRIRTIKPEILEDAVTGGLSDVAFRIFIAVIVLSDDYGRFRAEPGWLRGQIYWSRDMPLTTFTAAMKELGPLVRMYSIKGQRYGEIRNWAKHQKVDKPGKPRIPAPTEDSRDSRESLATLSQDSRETFAPHHGPRAEDLDPLAISQAKGHPNGMTPEPIADVGKPQKPEIHAYTEDPCESVARLSRECRDTLAPDHGPPTMDQDQDPPARAREGRDSPTVETVEANVEIGTASAVEVRATFESAVASATGKPFLLARAPFHDRDLCALTNAHGPSDSVSKKLDWLRAVVPKWVAAIDAKFASGWTPAKLLDWLNAGCPSRAGPSAKQRGPVTWQADTSGFPEV